MNNRRGGRKVHVERRYKVEEYSCAQAIKLLVESAASHPGGQDVKETRKGRATIEYAR